MAPKSIAALVLLVSCAPPRYPENPVHVHLEVVVDTAFTDPEVEAIALGVNDWESATDHLEITVFEAPCTQFRPAQSICVVPQHSEDTACGDPYVGCFTDKDRTIGLDKWALSLRQLRQTATHEIGHAMGLSHSKTGNAMAYRVDLQTPPTCADVAAFWRLYDVQGVCKSSR